MTRVRKPATLSEQSLTALLWKPVIATLVTLLPITALALPDLTLSLQAPERSTAGADIGQQLRLTVANQGDRNAPGTQSSPDGYMVDIFITRQSLPNGYARYNEHYVDGVLLKGGRVSNTRDVGARRRTGYSLRAFLPTDIPAGHYQLCARVDPGSKVREANERNNTQCVPLQIEGQRLMRVLPDIKLLLPQHKGIEFEPKLVTPDYHEILPKPVTPPTAGGASKTTRTLLEDGSIVLTWPDGSQRRLRPDGTVEYVSAEGEVMVPYAMQVQGADLPTLPDDLTGWGNILAADLGLILENILTEAEAEAFKQTEEGKDYYELVDWRMRSIIFLTAQGVEE